MTVWTIFGSHFMTINIARRYSFYFPPNTKQMAYANIGETIADLTERGHDVLIAGDFNIREFKIATDNRSTTRDPRLNELLSIMQITGLQSYNSVPNHQGKTLDLVLSNLDSLIVNEGSSIVKHPNRYHPPLEITLQKTKHYHYPKETLIRKQENKQDTKDYSRFNYAKGDYLKLYHAVQSIDFSPLYEIRDVDHATSFFQDKMLDAVDKSVPQFKKRTEPRYPKWFTCDTIRSIKLKEKIRMKYKKNNNEATKRDYQELRKLSKKMIKRDNERHNNNLENRIHEDPKSFWKFISERKANTSSPMMKN